MKNKIALSILLILPLIVQANYTVKIKLDDNTVKIPDSWSSLGVNYGPWVNEGAYYDCQGWTPSTLSYNEGVPFTQTGTCSQNQTRTATEIQKNTNTQETREKKLDNQSQVITTSNTRTAIGNYKPSCYFSSNNPANYVFLPSGSSTTSNEYYYYYNDASIGPRKPSTFVYNNITFRVGALKATFPSGSQYQICY